MIKLSDYVAKRLKEIYNIRHVFMVSGGGAMHLNDSFGKYIPYICNHHEQACAIAAEGYARVNQELAVVNITTGPGGLNCLNGVFGQWSDSVPVLYISGQVKTQTMLSSCPEISLRQLGDQEVDIVSCVKPITKYAVSLTDANDIKYVLDKAIYLALNGRKGPVWIDIPINLQAAMIDETKLKKYDKNEDEIDLPSINDEIIKLKELLNNSKKPLIIAGHGIRLSGAIDEFDKLIEKLNIPIVTTMNGFDIVSDDNSNFVARIGTVANRAGNFALQNADLVLSIGSRNNIRQVSYNWENFAKNAKLVCVDIDKAELDKPTIVPDVKINADCKTFIQKLLKEDIKKFENENWLNWCSDIKKKYPPLTEAKRIAHNPIEPYYFIDKLIQEFSSDEVVVGGNGTAFLVPFQVGKVKKGQRYIWNSGDASMGYDLPAAIGACFANNLKRTICLAGDGSIMMNLQELQTIKHYNLPIKLFVLNNNGYISIQQTQKNFFEGRMTACTVNSGVSIPDFIKIGKAFEIETVKIDKLDNLEEQIKNVLNSSGPILCEVMLSPDYIFAPKLSAKKLDDGTMISPSLEDLYPFLDRDEFEGNVI
ncbi:MAG: thiamine pyrophosphate-binding protein [Candidatus Gastranaerophilales bacterium]|nr:thiamine pyrophosphate-binding protein [Candidatus Gastranaerophilales bacterium]